MSRTCGTVHTWFRVHNIQVLKDLVRLPECMAHRVAFRKVGHWTRLKEGAWVWTL